MSEGEELEGPTELERQLEACSEGTGDLAAAIPLLLASQVFVLLEKEIPAESPYLQSEPLCVVGTAGHRAVAIFTSPARATPLARENPSHRFGLLVSCRWLLRQFKPVVGIAVNPGWKGGFEMSPDGFARFKRDFGLAEAG
jgi:hypothetical protein